MIKTEAQHIMIYNTSIRTFVASILWVLLLDADWSRHTVVQRDDRVPCFLPRPSLIRHLYHHHPSFWLPATEKLVPVQLAPTIWPCHSCVVWDPNYSFVGPLPHPCRKTDVLSLVSGTCFAGTMLKPVPTSRKRQALAGQSVWSRVERVYCVSSSYSLTCRL
jgi:hypothetical protein